MVSQVSGEGRPGAESSCSDLTDRPSTICFCGCQYAPHSPNYQGIQRGGLENAKSLIQSIKPFVFCWVSNDYAISCRGTDLASHRAGLINRHLILYTSASDDRPDNGIWREGNKSINCDTWPFPVSALTKPSECSTSEIYIYPFRHSHELGRWPNNNNGHCNESTLTLKAIKE